MLKNVISEVEKKVGRIRTPNNKNAPRTIDLDISFWDNMTCHYTSNTACSINTWYNVQIDYNTSAADALVLVKKMNR